MVPSAVVCHGMDVTTDGEVMVGPGPDAKAPQWFRKPVGPR